jgi:TonB family protein
VAVSKVVAKFAKYQLKKEGIEMKRVVSIAAFLFVPLALAAQETPKIINGGVLNGRAISLPKPSYPAEAKEAKLEGMVRIKVVIDELGNVESAEPVTEPAYITKTDADGNSQQVELPQPDPILVEAARSAALEAKFAPTRLSGVPVKVTGIVTYNFVTGESTAQKLATNGGVLNGKALELPAPDYPAAARAVKAQGTVTVQVIIGENGDVISAAAVSGHPLLRAAAAKAAREAKFEPTFMSGQPVKVSGVLTYHFALPAPNEN